jgi:hypothetical protein
MRDTENQYQILSDRLRRVRKSAATARDIDQAQRRCCCVGVVVLNSLFPPSCASFKQIRRAQMPTILRNSSVQLACDHEVSYRPRVLSQRTSCLAFTSSPPN